jgi:hypothetical protein
MRTLIRGATDVDLAPKLGTLRVSGRRLSQAWL